VESREEVILFLSEFDYQVGVIQQLFQALEQRLEKLDRENTPELVESTGYWLHNIYCAFEDLFKMVSGFWGNHTPVDGEYHIQLLKRMRLTIQGIRPALLSDESYRTLHELRGFRHAFRHAYTYGLDGERVRQLLRRVVQAKTHLLEDLQAFKTTISQVG